MEKLKSWFAGRYPLIWVLVTDRLRLTLWAVAGLAAALFICVQGYVFATANGLYTYYDLVIGGDFIVFDAVADAAAAGEAATTYTDGVVTGMLKERYPDADSNFLLYWQYPPAMFFIVLPLALLPYLASYGAWTAAGLSAYACAARAAWREKLALALLFASPITFQAFITGQTGFFSAALLATAAIFAGKRPVLAGLAAGLLTLKPQLGLLIPVAFAAAGCWRAFTVAAVTAIALSGASFLAFGAETWSAFLDAFRAQGDRLNSATIFPFRKLTSVYGAAAYLGAPTALANALQATATLALGAFVFVVWRRVKSVDLRAASLMVAAPLANPYGFYYELPILALGMLLLAKTANEEGWLAYEKQALAALWAACFFMPGDTKALGLPMPFMIAFGGFGLVARRALVAAGVRFASVSAPALQGS